MSNPISSFNDPYPAGNTYYFIGTSGGLKENIDKKVGGKCRSHNMKFAIYVCRQEENCNVDVLDGGWSLWQVNKATGLCERNCTDPAPQNGGFGCRGSKNIDCSKIISGRKPSPTTAKESTTETTTTAVKESTKETTILTSKKQKVNTPKPTVRTIHQPKPTSMPTTSMPTKYMPTKYMPTTSSTDSTISNKDALETETGNSDDVTLSMKGAVLTFVGLFILGCIVGIVQVLIILHVRSKRSGKQPEPQSPVNHV
ncbi:ephrin-B2-like isoform X1 [Paramuricea clavata]|uniref:Ephrin-B2-like isoform X1 n=2 Tax=Paramuricea clavata TaxID=317549 RepID=A0A7D9JX54_PARCT|nr:ephrin-B2-like isoform X1 [Paramuricea clavata]